MEELDKFGNITIAYEVNGLGQKHGLYLKMRPVKPGDLIDKNYCELVENYSNDLLDGTSTEYFKEGIPDIVEKTTEYKHGKRHGKTIKYTSTGQIIFQMNFIEGVLNGLFEVYNEDGLITTKDTYKDGVRHGNCDWFIHKPIKLILYSYYQNGKRDGASTLYNLSDNKIILQTNWINGEQIFI